MQPGCSNAARHEAHTAHAKGAPASICLYNTILLKCSEPFALFAAMSSTFNFIFKVLFTFPSWHLFIIGPKHIFSFGWILPPIVRFASKKRDSKMPAMQERLNMTHRNFTFIAAPPKRHTGTLSLPWQLHIAIWDQGPNCQYEHVLVRSPLLKESFSVCFPPSNILALGTQSPSKKLPI